MKKNHEMFRKQVKILRRILALVICIVIFTVHVSGKALDEIKETEIAPQAAAESGETTETEETLVEREFYEMETEAANDQIEDLSAAESGTYPEEFDSLNVADVADETSYLAALRNASVDVINITGNFMMNGYHANEVNVTIEPSVYRDILINGNNHTIDFQGMSSFFTSVSKSRPLSLTIRNLTAYGRNFYGPWRVDGSSAEMKGSANLRYENVHYYGAQLTASYFAYISFAGDMKVDLMTPYTSPIDGNTYSTQANGQANLEAAYVTVEEGARYYGRSLNAGCWFLYYGGEILVEKDAVVDLYGTGTGNEASSTIFTQGSLEIKEGSKVNIHNVNKTGGAIRPAVHLDHHQSSLKIHSGAELNILVDGQMETRAAVYMTAGSSVIVEDEGKLDINLVNSGTTVYAALAAGDGSEFVIGKQGVFDVKADGTAGRRLINMGNNCTFRFADAKRVNLQNHNTNQNTVLIYIAGAAGKLEVDVQSVKAWTAQDWAGDGNESYNWTPVYGVTAKYNMHHVTSVTANSLQSAVAEDFMENFRTQNFKRVLFEYIDDVEVTIDPLSNDTSKTNSYTITGVANPGAYITLSGNPYIPEAVIAGQSDNDDKMYHVIADQMGNYSVTLEEGHHFHAGEIIHAYAFLNGKDDSASVAVLDEAAPDAPVLDELSADSIYFTGTAEEHSFVEIFREDGTKAAEGYADADGNFNISVPPGQVLKVGEYYYATASDDAGNRSERSALVPVTGQGCPLVLNVADLSLVNAWGETVTDGFTVSDNLITVNQQAFRQCTADDHEHVLMVKGRDGEKTVSLTGTASVSYNVHINGVHVRRMEISSMGDVVFGMEGSDKDNIFQNTSAPALMIDTNIRAVRVSEGSSVSAYAGRNVEPVTMGAGKAKVLDLLMDKGYSSPVSLRIAGEERMLPASALRMAVLDNLDGSWLDDDIEITDPDSGKNYVRGTSAMTGTGEWDSDEDITYSDLNHYGKTFELDRDNKTRGCYQAVRIPVSENRLSVSVPVNVRFGMKLDGEAGSRGKSGWTSIPKKVENSSYSYEDTSLDSGKRFGLETGAARVSYNGLEISDRERNQNNYRLRSYDVVRPLADEQDVVNPMLALFGSTALSDSADIELDEEQAPPQPVPWFTLPGGTIESGSNEIKASFTELYLSRPQKDGAAVEDYYQYPADRSKSLTAVHHLKLKMEYVK